MESRKLPRYLVLDTFIGQHIGIYPAEMPDEAIALCLQDPAVQQLLRSLAKMALKRRLDEQRYPAHEDDYQASKEIRRLHEESKANPLLLLAGVLSAQDVDSICRLYKPHIQLVVARRMGAGEDSIREEAAGMDVFESNDLVFGSYQFHARCVRLDGDRLSDAELTIELLPPCGVPPEEDEAPTSKGNGKPNKLA
jgi:hypothetical protein